MRRRYISRNLINRTDKLVVASCSFRTGRCQIQLYILTFEAEIFSIVEPTTWYKQKGKKNVLPHDLLDEDNTIQSFTSHSFVYKMRWAWSDTWTPLIMKICGYFRLAFQTQINPRDFTSQKPRLWLLSRSLVRLHKSARRSGNSMKGRM